MLVSRRLPINGDPPSPLYFLNISRTSGFFSNSAASAFIRFHASLVLIFKMEFSEHVLQEPP